MHLNNPFYCFKCKRMIQHVSAQQIQQNMLLVRIQCHGVSEQFPISPQEVQAPTAIVVFAESRRCNMENTTR